MLDRLQPGGEGPRSESVEVRPEAAKWLPIEPPEPVVFPRQGGAGKVFAKGCLSGEGSERDHVGLSHGLSQAKDGIPHLCYWKASDGQVALLQQ